MKPNKEFAAAERIVAGLWVIGILATASEIDGSGCVKLDEFAFMVRAQPKAGAYVLTDATKKWLPSIGVSAPLKGANESDLRAMILRLGEWRKKVARHNKLRSALDEVNAIEDIHNRVCVDVPEIDWGGMLSEFGTISIKARVVNMPKLTAAILALLDSTTQP